MADDQGQQHNRPEQHQDARRASHSHPEAIEVQLLHEILLQVLVGRRRDPWSNELPSAIVVDGAGARVAGADREIERNKHPARAGKEG